MLLDIHPEPEHSRIEVWRGRKRVEVGAIDESHLIEAILAAREELQARVRDGEFLLERQVQVEVLHHFDSVEEWLAEVDNEWEHAEVDPALVSRVRTLMAGGDAEIAMRERVRAARLRRAARSQSPTGKRLSENPLWYSPGTWVTELTGHMGNTLAIGSSSEPKEVESCPGLRLMCWRSGCGSSRRGCIGKRR